MPGKCPICQSKETPHPRWCVHCERYFIPFPAQGFEVIDDQDKLTSEAVEMFTNMVSRYLDDACENITDAIESFRTLMAEEHDLEIADRLDDAIRSFCETFAAETTNCLY